MPIIGTNGATVTTDAITCEVGIDGHYLTGIAIPTAPPPLPAEPYLYLNTSESVLYYWNAQKGVWDTDYSHIANIQQFAGGIADGVSDNTAAAQAAHDALPKSGGVLYFPPSANDYRISTINVTKSVKVIGGGVGSTVIRKIGAAGVAERAIFDMRNALNLGFVLEDIEIDLNGEGSERMGQAGLIENATSVSAGITGISGPPNSAIYALRCSHIYVNRCYIHDTGESGLLFRNCAHIYVTNTRIVNTSGAAIEFSFPETDGGTGKRPLLDTYHVHGCTFEDIDDFKLGAGNAVGVSFAGNINAQPITNARVTNCSFLRCDRDIHVELSNTSRVEGFQFSRNYMKDSRQGSIAIIRGRDGEISDNTIINPCGAPTAALNPGFPELYVFYIAVGDNVTFNNNRVYDRRNVVSEFFPASANMTAGSALLTSIVPAFTADYVGTWAGVKGAGPGGGALVGLIVQVNSPTEAVLSIAARNTVSVQDFAFGGAIRRGITARVSNNIVIKDNILRGLGTHSGLTLEPASYAIRLSDINEFAVVRDNIIFASTGDGTKLAGIHIEQSATINGRMYVRENSVQGYVDGHDGFHLTEISGKHMHPGRKWFLVEVNPSPVAGAFGAQVNFLPRDTGFDVIFDFEIEVDNHTPGEVVTVHVRTLFNNGGDQNLNVSFSGNQVVRLSAQQLALLNRDNRIMTHFYAEARSTASGSAARARITALALEH